MSTFRGAIKAITDTKITAHYNVDPSDEEAANRLKAALLDVRYVFPGDPLVSDSNTDV